MAKMWWRRTPVISESVVNQLTTETYERELMAIVALLKLARFGHLADLFVQ